MYKLKEIPLYDRPRERLISVGANGLSNIELFAILLSSGTKTSSVMEISKNIIETFPELDKLNDATINELKKIKGIGNAKAISILACIELGKRINKPVLRNDVINNSKTAYNYLKDELQNLSQEKLVAIYLNVKSQVILKKDICQGGISSINFEPRDLLKWGIKESAQAIIMFHNHPSGDPTPSIQDIEVTKKVIEASKVVGIMVCDHIIIGKNCYFSFKEKGIINSNNN